MPIRNVVGASTIRMDNDLSFETIGIDITKVRMFDGDVRTLSNVKHIPNLRRRLISLGALETLGYVFI